MAPVIEVDSDDSNFQTHHAHMDGHVALAYSLDGKILYTGGSDGFIRAFAVDHPEKDASLVEYFDGPVTSLHCSFDFLVGCDTHGATALFSHEEEHPFTALLTRANPGAASQSVRFGVGGKKIAVATEELSVKVIDVRKPTEDVQILNGHTKAVNSVSWNADGSVLVTTSMDGDLRIWDLANDDPEPKCLQVLEGIFPVTETAAATQAIWHPNGKLFAIATKSHGAHPLANGELVLNLSVDIALYSKDGWSRSAVLSQDGHNCDITAIAWSPNGYYLASAGSDCKVIIWDLQTKSPIYQTTIRPTSATESTRIAEIVWRLGPGANALSISDNTGQLTIWDNVIPSDSGRHHPCDGPPFGTAAATSAPSRPAPTAAPKTVVAASTSKAKARNDELDEDMFADDMDDDNGWIDDDLNGEYTDKPQNGGDAEMEDELPPRLDIDGLPKPIVLGGSGGGLRLTGPSQSLQPAFQPGATPFKDKRRYLAFNEIGVIHIVDRDTHNLVSVEFHDRSARQGYQFDDNYKFEMACLGERGIAYACPARGDLPSVINYRPYRTWAQTGDWQLDMPKGESIIALGLGGVPMLANSMDDDDLSPALGTGILVAATSAGYLRFFSASGLQRHLIDLGEEVVSLAVGKEWVFVVHRGSASSDGRQVLNYTILDSDTFEFVQQGVLPLMRGQRLTWIGMTSDEIPAIYKSSGVLSLLSRSRRPGQARWTPALDTNLLDRREGKQESYWPVNVSTKYLHCVILKGEEKHPFFPTPLMQDFSLQIPAVGLDGQQGVLEETYLRDTVILEHMKDGLHPDDYVARTQLTKTSLELDKQLLVLMQTACKAEQLEQALEAARLMNQPQTLEAAIKLAAFFHLVGLQEKIGLIKEARTGETAVDRERRDSKWGHLVDNRTIVDSSLQLKDYGNGSKKTNAINAFDKPLDQGTQKRSLGDKSGLGSRPVALAPKLSTRNDSGHGSSEYDVDEDSMMMDESMAPSIEINDEPEMPAAPAPVAKAKSLNPFAKTNLPPPSTGPTPSSSNPFAKKSAASAKGVDLKRSGSFLDRAHDAGQKGKGKKAAARDTSRQSTLFGMPAPAPAEATETKKGRGKKRKSGANEEEEESQKTDQGSLSAFLTSKDKETGTIMSEPEEDLAGETQLVEDEQSESVPKRARLEKDSIAEAEDETQPAPLLTVEAAA